MTGQDKSGAERCLEMMIWAGLVNDSECQVACVACVYGCLCQAWPPHMPLALSLTTFNAMMACKNVLLYLCRPAALETRRLQNVDSEGRPQTFEKFGAAHVQESPICSARSRNCSPLPRPLRSDTVSSDLLNLHAQRFSHGYYQIH